MNGINERIATLRKELGLTQDEFGSRIGIKKSAVSKLENGTNNPTEATIKLLVKEFHVNAVWLELGEGEMFSTGITEDQVDTIFADSDPFVRTWMKALLKLPQSDWDHFKEQLERLEALRKEGG